MVPLGGLKSRELSPERDSMTRSLTSLPQTLHDMKQIVFPLRQLGKQARRGVLRKSFIKISCYDKIGTALEKVLSD